MDLATLRTLAWKHTKNTLAEELYIHTGYDMTKPVAFYGLVNERCNVKCRYCEYWRLDHYVKEMTIDEWKRALTSIHDFVGRFSISFSGGEPFIKPGFIDLLAWCNSNDIMAGVTTNGSAMTQRNAEKVADANPFNVNFSVDAPSSEVHDYLRGYKGLFDKLSKGIRFLIEAREARGLGFPIIIKPTVNSRNFRHLPALVEWVAEIGATSVNLQPMNRWTKETYDELWVEKEHLPELEKVVERLVEMKQAGAPILTPENIIQLMPAHFREEKAPPEVLPCRIGLRDFFIRTDGTVELCLYYPAVGNVKEQSARDIWYGEKAQEIRRKTISCDKLCLVTCLSQKTLKDKVKMGLALLRKPSPSTAQPDEQRAPFVD